MYNGQSKYLGKLALFISLMSINACSRKSDTADNSGIDGPNAPGATTSTRVDDAAGSGDQEGSPTDNNNGASDELSSNSKTQETDSDTTNSTDASQTENTGSNSTSSATSTITGETNAQGQILCGSKVWSCGDGLDNDNDGKIDLEDPECISPCDDTEGTFATALPGQNSDCKSDCYFDADSGSGNDKCDFNLKCDSLAPAANIGCAYDPNINACEASVPKTCLDVCLPLVPNGCDCFGCCEIKSSTGSKFIYLGSSDGCNLDNLDQCSSCTFNSQCSNSCNRQDCELCFGDEELPAHCTQTSCPDGVRSCKASSDCRLGEYCLTGCCAFNPG